LLGALLNAIDAKEAEATSSEPAYFRPRRVADASRVVARGRDGTSLRKMTDYPAKAA
jgi:hypothetical protein